MGHIYELADSFTPRKFHRAVPGPVRRLDTCCCLEQTLMLRWKRPAGGTFITGYRIERTREGRDHEIIGETGQLLFFVKNIPLNEPWFYRVTAFNLRGDGGFRLVWLFRQSSSGKILLMPVAAIPGLRVNV